MACIYKASNFMLAEDGCAPQNTQDKINKLISECKEIKVSEYYYSWTSVFVRGKEIYLARFEPITDEAIRYSFVCHRIFSDEELRKLFITKHDMYNEWDEEAKAAYNNLCKQIKQEMQQA